MAVNPVASACRSCRYYTPSGRRGGHCEQLGVQVRGSWKACSLALPPFAPSWEELEEVLTRSNEILALRSMQPLEDSKLEVPDIGSTCTAKKTDASPLAV